MSTGTFYNGVDIGIDDVFNNQRSSAVRTARCPSGNDCGADIVECALHEDDRTDRRRGHVDPDLAIVDVQILVSPTPVPELVDGDVLVVECQVAHRVLLVAKTCTGLASVEDQIGHDATAALFHEDANVVIFWTSGQLEDAVLDRSCLRRGPMERVDLPGHICGVEDHVADLAEEDIGALEVEFCPCQLSTSGWKAMKYIPPLSM